MHGRLCVFCGSSFGNDPQYRLWAEETGRLIADANWGLVYGGGHVGLMGAVADSALRSGGEVIGVIPTALHDKEVAHHGLTDLIITSSMHERKAKMSELSDGFLAIPGGLGTFEELFEILTWRQLGIHDKPIGLFNGGGYFNPLIEMIERAVTEGFVKPAHAAQLYVERDLGSIIAQLIETK